MLSICIVNWNTRDLLRECLASIEAYPPAAEPYETIVVDNASADRSADMVRVEFPDAALIANRENAGYAAGNNQALQRARGDRLLLLNPDVLLQPGTLTAALDFLDSRADAGMVGIRQIDSRGRTQQSVRGFPAPASVAWEAVGLSRLMPRSRFGAYRNRAMDYDRVAEVDQPMGTFLLVRREVYTAIGGMDEQFPVFFNDVDWCLRARESGWKIYYTPDARIVHYGPGSATGKAPKPAMIRASHRAMIRFYEKHYRSAISPVLFCSITAAILAGEAVRVAWANARRFPERVSFALRRLKDSQNHA